MKSVLTFSSLLVFTTAALAQNSIELSCRAKAKEAAAQIYSNCTIEARNSRVDEIRSNYQKELSALKAKYDKELEKLGGGKASSTQKSNEALKTTSALQKSIKTTKNSKASKGEIAKKLPSKTDHPESMAVETQAISEGNKVIAVGFDKDETTEDISSDAMESQKTESEEHLKEKPTEK